MIEVHLKEPYSPRELLDHLKTQMPDCKLKIPFLNPSAVMIQRGVSMALVASKGKRVEIKGGLNTQNLGIALGVGIGVILGVIGALIFLGIAYVSSSEKRAALERDVETALESLRAEAPASA